MKEKISWIAVLLFLAFGLIFIFFVARIVLRYLIVE